MSILARAKALRAQIESNATVMPDEEAVQFVELFPNWSPNGVSYTADTRVRYNGVLYRCLIDGNAYSPEVYPAGWEVLEG